MNKQEIFDKVWTGFEKQNWERSLDEGGFCNYRGYGGTCCAVGLLIPDDLYNPDFEGVSVNSIIENFDADGIDLLINVLSTLGLNNELKFLRVLQNLHDAIEDSNDLKKAYIDLAMSYNLKIPN